MVSRLVAGLVLLNAFVYVLVVAALWQSHQQYERQAILATQNLSQSLAINVSGTLKKIDVGLFAIATETERQLAHGQIDAPTLNRFIDAQHQLIPEVEGLRVTDARGQVLYGDKVPPGPARNVSDRELFQRLAAHNTREAQISDSVVSRVTGAWSMAIARRITGPDGAFAGIVYALLPLDWFNGLYHPFDLGPHGMIAMRDKDLRAWFRLPATPYMNTLDGRAIVSQTTADFVHRYPQGATYETVVKLDDTRRRMSFRPVDGQPLFIFVGQATQDYLASWRQEVAAGAILSLIFTIISIAIARHLYQVRIAELESITALRNSREEVLRSETRFRTLYDATIDAVWLRDDQFHMIDCNPAAVRLMGARSRNELMQTAPDDLWPPVQPDGTPSWVKRDRCLADLRRDGNIRVEWVYRRLDTGEPFPVEVLMTSLVLDGHPLLQMVVHDITERKAAEEQIRHLAYFDSLTGLPNRRLLMDKLDQALLASTQSGQYGALMILDLDNFKLLNDTRGHEIGDRFLVAVAARLSQTIDPVGMVCRLGGDEYVVILENLGHDAAIARHHAETRTEIIRAALDQTWPLQEDDLPYHSTSSIGVALFAGQDTQVRTLLKQADVALYQAKAAGRNAFCLFSPALQEVIDTRSSLEAALRHGLNRAEFQLYYQPQFSLDHGLIGAEALLRWSPGQHPSVSPAVFIPVAEESGLILRLGQWVMHSACEQLVRWAQQPLTRDLKIAINVSARQFHRPDFAARVRSALEATGANPSRLQLELTESVVLEKVGEVVERMQQIRQLGVTFSLDDFGTGFSSLSYLKQLPLDQIKIDQSFVHDLMSSGNDAAIVRAIVAIGRSLGLQVIAEGVETQDQLVYLTSMDCRVFQGYLLGRPVPMRDWQSAWHNWQQPETPQGKVG
ncbi:diguanylate cyclase (GGDEF)-like protein/PAS domain S-box-containing protein [Silvimonas terrae]|uniref:Diguanylate cyclase (GGDEF)-like protein/PAS domain S-box-containing protein n=1 Tax=Silvimonas terrae TaxID=300266 RepID=A0A840RF68_9NEIS|nr:EAL domain-containing protein [Silvimonas terrae]MBB5191667.1 diguanylate cyclase (GGDEF)-like protein/PAS domain S-box-containing protein [Silvimonas terrae]